MTDFELTSELLSFIERREERLLSWGFYDIRFSSAEIEQALTTEATPSFRDAIDSCGKSVPELLQRMEVGTLLHQVDPTGPSYRSRFAEGVRLMGRLRQRFDPNDWAVAPKLVSDIKILLASRRYPRRDLTVDQVWNSISQNCTQPNLQHAAFLALSQDRDGPIAFSAFQRDAIGHILGQYGKDGASGSIVSAGTGAGKTKAFYIPALLGCITELHAPSFTKALAIYPRTVLLADQFRELMSEAAKLRDLLRANGLRPIRIGALLGDTPKADWFGSEYGRRRLDNAGWRRVDGGYVVPYLKSPIDRNAELIWRDADRSAGRTCLHVAGGNTPIIPDREVSLTRDQIRNELPDFLFLTAEMLNRELGSPQWARTFGIADSWKPRLLLLDEVHTYEGLPGAQVAWILRRWRYWAKTRKFHAVGLSATLKQATTHLAATVGLSPNLVTEFKPAEADMTEEGMEYNLVLKGDPSSGTALLSTAIQAGMLLTRLLTPRAAAPTPIGRAVKPEEFYSRKVFGFTDNVDSVNRWYADMSNAEAQRLARLRIPPAQGAVTPAQFTRLRHEGQTWELPLEIGHRLQQPLVIGRCTAMDATGGMAADLIIATSKLEVGFDDPEVGAVLHYKRPVSMSSFIQRKGRAGRRRGTRPITAVILSDYGQDRWAFQHAHRLFLPEIDNVRLPVQNPHVLRTQAVYFLVDWLGRRIGGYVGPFDFLSRPVASNSGAQDRAIVILQDFIARGSLWTQFRRDFSRLFSRPMISGEASLSEADLDAILWESPRPLLRHAVPALLRRLEARWKFADPKQSGAQEDAKFFRPLPEFLPAATFSDLEIADVQVDWVNPPYDKREETLSVSHGLSEGCPGHVSKRFSLRLNESGYWNPISLHLAGGDLVCSVHEVFPDSVFIESIADVQVYQPQTIPLTPRPPTIRDSSNGIWTWQSALTGIGQPLRLPVFSTGRWRHVIDGCEAFLHRDARLVRLLRYATEAEYELRNDRGQGFRGTLRLQSVNSSDQTEPRATQEAIGFIRTVDGIRVRINRAHLDGLPPVQPDMEARLRADFFLHRLSTDPAVRGRVNVFMAELVWRTSLAMLTSTAIRQHVPLREAQALLNDRAVAARHVADRVFGIQGTDQNGGDVDGRRKTDLLDLWSDPLFVQEIARLERILWEPLDSEFMDWLRRRHVATIAQAFRIACVSRLSDVTEDDFALDVVWDETGDASLFLTELASGGLGQIESVVYQLRADPEAFNDSLEDALGFCPRAESRQYSFAVAEAIHQARHRGSADDSLALAFDAVRSARTYADFASARDTLCGALEDIGLSNDRSHVVATVNEFLAPGSLPETDRLLHLLNRQWRRCCDQVGLAIDARVFAYLSIRDRLWCDVIGGVFGKIGGEIPSASQLYVLVQRMLFDGCEDSCRDCLDQPNRYNAFGKPSRALTAFWLALGRSEIDADTEANWMGILVDEVCRSGSARVISSSKDKVALLIPTLLARELEAGYLLQAISVSRIDNIGGRWATNFRLRGVIS